MPAETRAAPEQAPSAADLVRLNSRNHIRQLEALGYKVILECGASLPLPTQPGPDPLTLRRAPPRARLLSDFRIRC